MDTHSNQEIFGEILRKRNSTDAGTFSDIDYDEVNATQEGGAWFFGDAPNNHVINRYSNNYYDPTTGTISSSIESFITAKLIELNKPSQYIAGKKYNIYEMTYVSDTRIKYNIAAHMEFPKKGFNWGDLCPYFYIDTRMVASLAAGEVQTIAMSEGSTWTAESNANWINFEESLGGMAPFGIGIVSMTNSDNNENTLTIVTDPNTSNQLRTGIITVNKDSETYTVTVHQDGAGTQLSVSKTIISATANGKEDVIAINSNASWIAVSDAEWVDLGYGLGIANDELPIIINRNNEPESRIATITISGEGIIETITITQDAHQNSSDATLDDFTISTGTLMPSFNPAVTTYTISVPYNVGSVILAATAMQSNATVAGVGEENLSMGTNNFIISVTAPNGTTTINYTIIVVREQDSNQPVPTSLAFNSQSYSATIPETGNTTETISATIKDQAGNTISGISPVYSIDPSYSGVTINESTGVVTITSSAVPGDVIIYATYGSISEDVTLTLSATVPAGTYEIYFDEEWYNFELEYYPDEDWYNPSITLSATAMGTDEQGNALTADIVYTNGYTENSTGEFTALELWDDRYVTAIATFSDGNVVEVDTEVWITIISPRR